ncbi:MAG: nucleotidyltransferase domain-containing protein [Ktedonobacterales bacterium]
MGGQGTRVPLPENHQRTLNRFVAACQTDERIVAAFLGGSFARAAGDAYSDLDLNVIIADAAYDDFFAGRAAFIRQLGEPVFLEDFEIGGADFVFFTLANESECELGLGRESHFTHLHVGPYQILLDHTGILAGARFPSPNVAPAEQVEALRRMINWFWHDLSHHFMTPLARGQLWSAFGGLEDLRRTCVNLARLNERFSAAAEGYEKVEHVLPAERLAPLQETCCPLERECMLQAARVIVTYYESLARPLAHAHALAYPTELARMMVDRLERMS